MNALTNVEPDTDYKDRMESVKQNRIVNKKIKGKPKKGSDLSSDETETVNETKMLQFRCRISSKQTLMSAQRKS